MTNTLDAYAGSILTADEIVGESLGARARIEVAEDCATVTVIWTEELRFHLDYAPECMRHLTTAAAPGQPISFTDEARQALADTVREHLGGSSWNLPGASVNPAPEEEWEDVACVALSFHVGTVNGPETTLDEIARMMHPFIAALANLTDPGTFGVPYVMGHLAQALTRTQESECD